MPATLLQSTTVIGAMTLLSRITGLLRDVVFAHLLGDRAAADVFFVAFRIPNFFRRISGEGAFAAAFVPVFTDYRMHRTSEESRRFLQLLLGRFGLVLLLASAAGILAAPALVALVAPGFLRQPEQFRLAVDATRVTFPYVFFISLVALAAAMLNTCGRFAAPAATPVLLNICLIAAAWWLAPHFASAPLALALGVLCAGLAQLLFQIPFLRREKLLVRPRIVRRARDAGAAAGVMQVFKLTVPALFGVSVAQINVLVGTLLASFLATGSISWLYYSDRLMEFPVGVFGIALGTAILPSLSRAQSAGAAQAFSKTLDWAARWVCLICVPASVGLGVLAAPMIATIFFHGDFSAHGVRMSAASLSAFALGLGAIVMVKVLAPGFYARKNTRTPVRIAALAMGANIILSMALVWPLRHVGLALATSLAAYVNAALLWRALRRERVYRATPGWARFFCKVCAAALAMGALLWWGGGDAASWLTMPAAARALRLAWWVAAGGACYFAALALLG
ncbi:MAG: murein biosynthesis integral membrane protein MurJ, partial [Gammaproteobacteria bacterium]